MTITEAISAAMDGKEIRAIYARDGKHYDVRSIILPCPAVPYVLIQLNKPFGNVRPHEVELYVV